MYLSIVKNFFPRRNDKMKFIEGNLGKKETTREKTTRIKKKEKLLSLEKLSFSFNLGFLALFF